jgi:hypothetical protein
VLAPLALHPVVLIRDGSVVGRGWVALMIPGVYQGRALPWAWQVRQGKQGHCPADLPIALITQGHPLIPLGASVVGRGDGAFAGTTRQDTRQEYRWAYGVRTGRHGTGRWDGERCRCATGAAWSKPETLGALPEGRVTAAA